MVTAYQIREYFKDHTRSVMVAKNPEGNLIMSNVVLELPWKDNERNVSCIFEGLYHCTRRWTKKFGWHYIINEVPGRDLILQHPANYTRQIEGCQIPGSKIVHLNNDDIPDIIDTRKTLDAMLKSFGNEYMLHIGSFAPPSFPCKIQPNLSTK